MSTYNNCASIL